METNENSKMVKVSAKAVTEKEFLRTEAAGYDPDDVDHFLDLVVDTLKFYEFNFQRYQASKANFESLISKSKMQESVIDKLRKELNDMYSNGYSNQAMMRRVQNLEATKNNMADVENRLANIERLLSRLIKNPV
ncbi:DivIVA domain-containing protein [[Mycoplasma] testudinis]|uniref:DivIVA domain-containing protein n=1 Tax=[Mycoplasma] testudinis TaxID=33924 RepID=UPI000697DED0|nr:DivIVA domain-containing protein [[Mycoplasma] testudinis]